MPSSSHGDSCALHLTENGHVSVSADCPHPNREAVRIGHAPLHKMISRNTEKIPPVTHQSLWRAMESTPHPLLRYEFRRFRACVRVRAPPYDLRGAGGPAA